MLFSQNSRVVIGKDTLYTIPVENLRRANELLAERGFLSAENWRLTQKNATLYKLSQQYQGQAAAQDSAAKYWQTAYSKQALAVTVANRQAEALQKQLRRRTIVTYSAGGLLVICLIKFIVQ